MPAKISIVTPSFYQAKWLQQCSDSILCQNYPNLQNVVMDGGSTDGSQQVIEKFSGKLHAYRSEKDAGQYDAINRGFSLPAGKSWDG